MKNTNKKGQKKIYQIPEEKIERDKRFLMGAGVCFFMSLIFVLWIFSFNNFWQAEEKKSDSEMESFWQNNFAEWNNLSSELDSNLEKAKKEIRKITEGKSAEKQPQEQEKWEELKKKLEAEAEAEKDNN